MYLFHFQRVLLSYLLHFSCHMFNFMEIWSYDRGSANFWAYVWSLLKTASECKSFAVETYSDWKARHSWSLFSISRHLTRTVEVPCFCFNVLSHFLCFREKSLNLKDNPIINMKSLSIIGIVMFHNIECSFIGSVHKPRSLATWYSKVVYQNKAKCYSYKLVSIAFWKQFFFVFNSCAVC